MPNGHGSRARTRDSFSRPFRKHGYIPISTYLRTYKLGDYVDIRVNSAVMKVSQALSGHVASREELSRAAGSSHCVYILHQASCVLAVHQAGGCCSGIPQSPHSPCLLKRTHDGFCFGVQDISIASLCCRGCRTRSTTAAPASCGTSPSALWAWRSTSR